MVVQFVKSLAMSLARLGGIGAGWPQRDTQPITNFGADGSGVLFII